MKNTFLLFVFCLSLNAILSGQEVSLEGYAYETGNRGYLNVVLITANDVDSGKELGKVFTNNDGYFSFTVPVNSQVKLLAIKDMFEEEQMEVAIGSEKVFVKLEMQRSPGYIFEITLAHKRENDEIPTDAIRDARIEVYNNTKKKEEMVLEAHANPEFRVNLLKGNHYTILIRKEGYLAKRMEAFVDVEGCILCFEGIGQVQPGVSESLTEGNDFGVLLANVEMERVFSGKKMEIQDIYFDLGKYNISKRAAEELNKVITLMMDNPKLTIEMGSHTDSRGTTESNQVLSEQRAKATAQYILNNGDIRKNRMSYFGYGESQLVNDCADEIPCTETQHARNRRTELKIVNISDEAEFKSLQQMKREEEMEKLILQLSNEEQIKVGVGETLEEKLDSTKKNENPPMPDVSKEKRNLQPSASALATSSDGLMQGTYIVVIAGNESGVKPYKGLQPFKTASGRDGFILGKYNNRSEAEELIKTKFKDKFPSAYVATYKDGIKIE